MRMTEVGGRGGGWARPGGFRVGRGGECVMCVDQMMDDQVLLKQDRKRKKEVRGRCGSSVDIERAAVGRVSPASET